MLVELAEPAVQRVEVGVGERSPAALDAAVEQPAEDLLGVGRADRLERAGDVGRVLRSRLPACAISQSRRPHVRENGCVFASDSAPHVAWRMCSTNSVDSTCSHASASWLRIDACGGAGSLRIAADGSPAG